MRRLLVVALALLVAALLVNDGALATALGAIALVVAGIAWFEAGTDSTRELAFVSNLFLGEGIWTPQQMLGWGLCGAVGAILSPFLRNRWALAGVAALLGFAFSAMMDLWLWWGFFPHTWASLVAVLGRGLWF